MLVQPINFDSFLIRKQLILLLPSRNLSRNITQHIIRHLYFLIFLKNMTCNLENYYSFILCPSIILLNSYLNFGFHHQRLIPGYIRIRREIYIPLLWIGETAENRRSIAWSQTSDILNVTCLENTSQMEQLSISP